MTVLPSGGGPLVFYRRGKYPIFLEKGDVRCDDQMRYKINACDIEKCTKQWRIQDFPAGGCQPQRVCTSLLFSKLFAGNCMQMKEFGPRRGGGTRIWCPPGSATAMRPSNAILSQRVPRVLVLLK